MNRQVGLLRQHEIRASQQVVQQQSTQSLARIQEYSSTPPQRSQRSSEATNMFVTRILDECGLEIKMADEENMNNNDELNLELKVDQGILAKHLSQRLRSSSDSNINTIGALPQISVKQFETELISFFSNDSIFRSSLLPTSSADDVSPLRAQQQDSLMRILLCVDELQMFLAKYLLKRLVRFDNKGGDRVIVQNLPLSMIRLILQTFHYLPIGKLTNAKDLLYFYLDVIDLVTNNDVRCQMISLVTDIFCDDYLQIDIVTKLEEKLESTNVDIIKQVLSTLTTIQLNDSTDRRIRERIIPMIMTGISDVKVECFNYLFETSTKTNMFETVLLFRDVATVSGRRSDRLTCSTTDNFQTVQSLFERFEHYFNSSRILFRTCQEKHPITADLCLKINSYFLFDFFIGILLANRSYYNNLKTFIKKLGEDPSIIRSIYLHLTSNLSFVFKFAQHIFRFAIAIFQHLSFGNFPTITTTNNSLSSSNVIHLQIGLQLAFMLIDLLFSVSENIKHTTDFNEQIINALVRLAILFQNRYLQRLHILKLLKRFCYRYKSKVLNCESYIKNLFEYIDTFRGDHLRLVFSILASMYNTGVYNDLNMFVTKCLIQPYKEKARGVFGAIEIFRSLLLRHVTDSTQAPNTGNTRLDGKMSNHENELKDLLGLVQSSGMQCPQTLALFYDELATILGSANSKQTNKQQQQLNSSSTQLDTQSLDWFAISAADMFQEAFLNDTDASTTTNSLDINRFAQQTRIVYNFDGQTTNASILNLANIISKYHQYRTMSDTCSSPILLAPMLRLIVLASWSNIDQVDAVLQCSLRIPDVLPSADIDIDVPKSLESYREKLNEFSSSSLNILCDVYYYASRLFREICNLLSLELNQNESLISTRLEQLADIEEHFSICVQICRQKYGFYEPICSNIERNKMKKVSKKITTTKTKANKQQGTKRAAPVSDDEEDEASRSEDEENTNKKKPRTATVAKLKPKPKPKSKQSSMFDMYEFDIRPLEYVTFPYISKYLERLPKSNGKQRLTILRCVSTLMGDLHRLLTTNNSSISSIGMVKKRFITHTAPTTLLTQQIRVDTDDNDEDVDENNDDKLDFITLEYFEMFLLQVINTMKYIHTFMSASNTDAATGSMETDDDDDMSFIIDRDQSRNIASRAFYYALDSFYFLLSLFKVKQTNWQKDLDRDETCLSHLLKTISNQILLAKKTTGKEENERVRILTKIFTFTDILNLIDSTRLCQSLELFIQLFDDETQQDELYKIFTGKCRQLLEECSLDANSSTVLSFSKISSVRAVETLLNLYLLHLEPNEINSVIDGLIHYSLKIFVRAEKGSKNDTENTDDDTLDNPIVDLSTWNIKSTFVVYFRCLFKHFIIKARSIKLPNESKKKNELEQICTEWLELNELFRKFVSFVTIDQIYAKNAMVISTVLRCSKQYIDVFRARSMPTLDLYFLHDTHGTKQLLTVLQKSTRLLQSLCNMVKKDQKHMSCIRLIPVLKRTLEMLMCRAKLMVDINNCPANVFCIGQLKAKDLKGNELTDTTYRQQQEEEENSSIMDEDSSDVRPDQDEDDDEEEQGDGEEEEEDNE
ncbi:unnamed protein product [Rotaria socialis]|uniref:Fanconi anemia group D2 protein n=1 Tax=Rotaria socialis TaxID=392032 RepID=A0A818D3W9_9BILA|nr:unnamed protein product [Rotaria socialis]CAF4328191.1 unnamed protein product [Rotaria socialis]